MSKNFTGYKVPKNLNFRQIEVSFFKEVPTLTNTKEFWYLFYNDSIRKWNIPQKCNGTDADKDILTKIQVYISNHYGYDRQQKQDVISELLPIAKEYATLLVKERKLDTYLEEKKKRDYDRIERKLGSKFKVKHI